MKDSMSISILITISSLIVVSYSECRNTSASKYDFSQPSEILHYYSTCSVFTRRTCCSAKNLETLTRKIKRTAQSLEISSNCKNTISHYMCVACDGDWGEGQYSGICGSKCLDLYYACQDDYFVLDSNTGGGKLRACKEEDWVCWKLKDILLHFYVDIASNKGQVQICSYFDLIGSEQDNDCWRGQISSQFRGRGKDKIDYTAVKKPRRIHKSWFQTHMKEIIYIGVVVILGGALLYKLCKPARPRYYRLN